MPKSEVLRRRGKYNALQRHRPADDPAVIDAARDLAAERLAEHVRRTVDAFPPLTPEQISRISVLLYGTGGDPAA